MSRRRQCQGIVAAARRLSAAALEGERQRAAALEEELEAVRQDRDSWRGVASGLEQGKAALAQEVVEARREVRGLEGKLQQLQQPRRRPNGHHRSRRS